MNLKRIGITFLILAAACFATSPNPQIAFSVSVNANGVQVWDNTTGYLWVAGPQQANGYAAVTAISTSSKAPYCLFSVPGNPTGMVVSGNYLYIASSNGLFHTNVVNQIATACTANVGTWQAGVSMGQLAIVPGLSQLWTIMPNGTANVYNSTSGALLFTFAATYNNWAVAYLVAMPNVQHGMMIATVGYPVPPYSQYDVYYWDGDNARVIAYSPYFATFQNLTGIGSWDARQGEVIWPNITSSTYYTDQPGSIINVQTYFLANDPQVGGPCTGTAYNINTGVLAEICQAQFGNPAGAVFGNPAAFVSGYVMPAVVVNGTTITLSDHYGFVVDPGVPGTLTAISY